MATTLTTGSAAEAGLNADQLDRIRSRAAQWVAEGLTDSLVVLVARRGVVALHEAYGRLTPEADARHLTTNDVFPVSSLTKPLTATALMMLVEEGLVQLNQSVTQYLPEMAGTGAEEILVRHLLTHTSGFDEADLFAFQMKQMQEKINLPPLPDNQHKAIHLTLNARYGCPPKRPPETLMAYCNHGFNLVAEIIRRASGTAFERFMHERLIAPLGMTESAFRLEDRFRARMVKRAHLENPFGADMNDERYLDTPWGSGGLKSTAIDIAKFGQLFLNQGAYGQHRLLSRASVRTMTTNQIPKGVPEEDMLRNIDQGSYGFGWFIFGDHQFPMNGALVPKGSFTHAGMGGSMLWVDPLNELVGVALQVWKFDPGASIPESPPKLTFAAFQDMATAAVF